MGATARQMTGSGDASTVPPFTFCREKLEGGRGKKRTATACLFLCPQDIPEEEAENGSGP